MSIVANVAKALLAWDEKFEDGTPYHGGWPLDDEGTPVAEVTQRGNYTLVFSDVCLPFESYSGDFMIVEEIEDVDGLPWMNPNGWSDDGETVTYEEYLEFVKSVTANGTTEELRAYFTNGERAALAEIAELNKQVGELVNKIVAIATPFGLSVTVDLGQRGGLDLDGPWDSSSAYC